MKAPLITGAYEARSIIASAQRSVNLYMEKNPEDAAFPFMLYPTPGLTQLSDSSQDGWRGLYTATNEKLYGVSGNNVYYIGSNWNLSLLGTIGTNSSHVHMVDNGNYVIIVDGSQNGYTIDLTNNNFAPISPGAFVGGDYIDYVDGYFLLNIAGTNEWYISLANEIIFDATDFASKNGFPDKIVAVGVSRRYIYLFGQLTSEIWFNAGDTVFPFERLPGVFMQYGCMNANTVAQMDGEFYWLSQSEQGNRFICRTSQFQAEKISTFAIDNELSGYDTVNDAFGYTYQISGHFFYVITFPTAQKTWVFDMSNGQWNEWLSIDDEGNLQRHRSNCFAVAYGKHVVGDFENGNLYMLDLDNYTDNDSPIPRIRSFYHGVDEDSNRIRYREFIADMEVGNGDGEDSIPLYLRWSDTRGKSWGNAISTSLGLEGEYLTSLQFQRLGMARDRVFELSWSAPVKTALAGAWVQVSSNNQ